MIYDPCLIYSFSDEVENNFEKDLSRFNCDVHSFQFIEVSLGHQFINSNKNYFSLKFYVHIILSWKNLHFCVLYF